MFIILDLDDITDVVVATGDGVGLLFSDRDAAVEYAEAMLACYQIVELDEA